MASNKGTKINQLLKKWPHGTVAVLPWLEQQGVYQQLAYEYEKGTWIKRIGQGAYIRGDDKKVEWSGGVYAIQDQLNLPIHVAGKSALLLKGFAHFIPQKDNWMLSLVGKNNTKLPKWFKNHSWKVKINYMTSELFSSNLGISDHEIGSFTIKISSPERAILEFLSLVPQQESFEEGKLLMENLTTLRPKVVQQLLQSCTSIKAKRLFLFLTEECNHPWFKKLNLEKINLGSGKRAIEKGGILNKKYGITVPKNMVQKKDDL